jgi:hypothetical protein
VYWARDEYISGAVEVLVIGVMPRSDAAAAISWCGAPTLSSGK